MPSLNTGGHSISDCGRLHSTTAYICMHGRVTAQQPRKQRTRASLLFAHKCYDHLRRMIALLWPILAGDFYSCSATIVAAQLHQKTGTTFVQIELCDVCVCVCDHSLALTPSAPHIYTTDDRICDVGFPLYALVNTNNTIASAYTHTHKPPINTKPGRVPANIMYNPNRCIFYYFYSLLLMILLIVSEIFQPRQYSKHSAKYTNITIKRCHWWLRVGCAGTRRRHITTSHAYFDVIKADLVFRYQQVPITWCAEQ